MMNRVVKTQSVWKRAISALDKEPESRWFALLVHHGGRLALLFGTAVAIYLFFPEPRVPDAAVFERGVVAPLDVQVSHPPQQCSTLGDGRRPGPLPVGEVRSGDGLRHFVIRSGWVLAHE